MRWSGRPDGTGGSSSVYDGGGQRVQTTLNGVTRNFVYNLSGQIVAEYRQGVLDREYVYQGGALLATDEQPRTCTLTTLDAFALYLNESQNFRAYIISYGGRRSCRGEALGRARTAKNYLSKIGGIDQERITAIDGGHLDNWEVQLWFGAEGEAPPNPLDY